MAALTIGLGYFTQQHEFPKIIGFFAPFFALYLLVSANSQFPISNSQFKFWLIVAIFLRLILVFSEPGLSNDVYRFIWDGRLLVQGYNPFDHLPMYYLENDVPVKGIDRALFEAFDAKNTYTVYPPVAQAQFASACWLFPQNIYWCTVVMKLWLFAFEVGSIFLIVKLLRRFDLPARNVLLYALNPLIIFEITGNLHFEGAMIFFLLLALWLLCRSSPSFGHRTVAKLGGNLKLPPNLNSQQPTLKRQASNNQFLSALAFALSICSKLLTLLFLPFFIKRMGWGRSLRYFTITGVVTVLLFLPIVNTTFLANFGDSLNLYFQKLEYNASLYYLLRWAGFQIWGYNQIAIFGPLLGVLAMCGILWMALRDVILKKGKVEAGDFNFKILPELWLFAIILYLVCTTTLHPWYLALPLALCVFTKWRFPIFWSGLIFLTYVNYSYEPYRENLWVVALEYTTVAAWFAWEWKTNRQKEQVS